MLPPIFSSEGFSDVNQGEKKTKSFFSKVQEVFFSIADKIIQQTKTSGTQAFPKGRVLQQKLPLSSEQLVLLQNEASQLKKMRQELIDEEGEGAACFITRYIDSCLSRLRGADELLKPEKEISGPVLVSADVLKQIMDLKNGNVLKRIKKDLVRKVRKIIYDDLAYIASYQEMVTAKGIQVPSELETIASILLGLLNSTPRFDDVIALYRWKRSIDISRQGLVSLAMLILERADAPEVIDDDERENERELERIGLLLHDLLSNDGAWVGAKYTFDEKMHDDSQIEAKVTSLRRSIELFISKFIDSDSHL